MKATLMAGASIAMLAGLLAGAAQAQTQTQTQTKDKTSAKDDDAVIVTVERKTQSLQKYGGTAVSIDGKTLKETGVQNITDLEGKIPGVQILPNSNNIEVWIRGVGSSNNTELGDPAAGTHLDGVYIPRPAGFGSAFFDIDRVEVNIGPQGTLRGRNATAGTVNIIPWHPGLNIYQGSLEVGAGNYGQENAEAMINIPFGDKVAVRLSGMQSGHGSYTKSIGGATNAKLPEIEDNTAGRAQLLFKPNDHWDLLVSADGIHERGTGVTGTNYAGVLGAGVDPDTIKDPRKVYTYAYSPHVDTVHNGLKGDLNYHGDAFNAELILSSRHLFSQWNGTPPGHPDWGTGTLASLNAGDSTGSLATDWTHFETQTMSNSQTQELRFTAPKGAAFDWTVGAFNFLEKQKAFLEGVSDQNAYYQGIEFNMPHVDGKSWALYTDNTWHMNDRNRFTFGVRYTEDAKERVGVAARYLMALGADDYNCCMGPVIGTPGFEFMGIDRKVWTIPNPTDPNAAQVGLNFYLGGIKSFGINDTVPSIFPNGQIPTGRTGPCVPNPATPYLVCAADGLYRYETIDAGEFWNEDASMKQHFVDWRLRYETDLTPDNLAYALVATGNKSGGFNDNIGTGGIAPTYRPEHLTNYELGSKNRFTFAGLPAKLNATVFYEDYKDQVLSSLLSLNAVAAFNTAQGHTIVPPTGFAAGAIVVNYNYNAANSAIGGTQIEGGLQFPEHRMTANFNLLWLPIAKVMHSQMIEDFRFQSDVDSVGAGMRDIKGKRLPRTAELQFNASFTQKFSLWGGQADWIIAPGYRSKSYFTIFNGEDYVYEAYKAGTLVAGSTIDNAHPYGVPVAPNTTTYRMRLDDTLPAYWTVDLGAGWTSPSGKVRVEAYGNNVTNGVHTAGILITQFNNTRFFTRPATYGMRLRLSY
ncbi:TonB-dependent receptor [Asticcacaulis solisilvae]|uniref:TonB-dependent receptor n=1 Tax=Asticcacaulis solisilvae TaxID=1217274 RepID=UPI003FD6C59C